MMLERYDRGRFMQLKKIDAAIFQAGEKIPFLAINPTNIEKEKEKVIADPSYDPFFEYDVPEGRLKEIIRSLDNIEKQDSEMGRLLEEKRIEYLNKSKMLLNIGREDFQKYDILAYGEPSNELVEKAKQLLELESSQDEKTITTKKAIEILKAEMTHYGFKYNVAQKEMSAAVDVNPARKNLYLKPHQMFSVRFIQQLIFHEIGTHVLRAENGRYQPFKIFICGFPDYYPTEEGLAAVNEERFGLLTPGRLKKYAARTVAVDMAKTKSFSEIYHFLRQHMSDSLAFTITLRVKRGISDTSKPGGWTKDHYYLEGYYRVHNYLKEGGKMKNLYYGKVGVQHAKELDKINGLSRPRYLPENQSFKSLLEFI